YDVNVVGLVELRPCADKHHHTARSQRKLSWHVELYHLLVSRQLTELLLRKAQCLRRCQIRLDNYVAFFLLPPRAMDASSGGTCSLNERCALRRIPAFHDDLKVARQGQ